MSDRGGGPRLPEPPTGLIPDDLLDEIPESQELEWLHLTEEERALWRDWAAAIAARQPSVEPEDGGRLRALLGLRRVCLSFAVAVVAASDHSVLRERLEQESRRCNELYARELERTVRTSS